MIYCSIKELGKDAVLYLAGTCTHDITGIIEVYRDKPPVVMRQPESGHISDKLLASLYVKYKGEFLEDNFREKLSYEIG